MIIIKVEKNLQKLECLYHMQAEDENELVVEPAYDDETDMTWYNKPKELKGTYITEPTAYKVNGKDVVMASLAIPILDENGKFLGVISIDYKLDTLEKISIRKNTTWRNC